MVADKLIATKRTTGGAWLIPCPNVEQPKRSRVTQETCAGCKYCREVWDNYCKCLYESMKEKEEYHYYESAVAE